MNIYLNISRTSENALLSLYSNSLLAISVLLQPFFFLLSSLFCFLNTHATQSSLFSLSFNFSLSFLPTRSSLDALPPHCSWPPRRRFLSLTLLFPSPATQSMVIYLTTATISPSQNPFPWSPSDRLPSIKDTLLQMGFRQFGEIPHLSPFAVKLQVEG